MRKPYRHCNTVLFASALLAVMACNNEDVPEDDPTVGTGGMGDTGTGETGGPNLVACWEPDGYDPVNPSLFQCYGNGGGELTFLVCENLNCAGTCSSPGNWSADSRDAGPFPFPPEPPATEPNARACCESDASAEQTSDGCEADCARAACKTALETLQQAYIDAANNPPPLCGAACIDRTQASLQTWIDFLEANFDACVEATYNGQYLTLPSADVESKPGALACGKLALTCALDEQTDPVDLETTCSTRENELLEADELTLECDLDGDIEIANAVGNDFTNFEGTLTLRRASASSCTAGSCWFSIDSLEIDADAFSGSGYIGRNMHGSLAYPGFGSLDGSTDEASLARGMLGIDVTMDGMTASTGLESYDFRMANSDTALFEVSESQFQIVDAYFAWQDYDLTIMSDVASCTCTNCP